MQKRRRVGHEILWGAACSFAILSLLFAYARANNPAGFEWATSNLWIALLVLALGTVVLSLSSYARLPCAATVVMAFTITEALAAASPAYQVFQLLSTILIGFIVLTETLKWVRRRRSSISGQHED